MARKLCLVDLIRKHGTMTPRKLLRLRPEYGSVDNARFDLAFLEWIGYGVLKTRTGWDGAEVVFAMHDDYKTPESHPQFDYDVPPRMVTSLLADADVVRTFKENWRQACPDGRVALMLEYFARQGKVDQEAYEARWRAVMGQFNTAGGMRDSDTWPEPYDGDVPGRLKRLDEKTKAMLLAIGTHVKMGTLGPERAAASRATAGNLAERAGQADVTSAAPKPASDWTNFARPAIDHSRRIKQRFSN